jgi:uncharacterized protein YkvS
MYDDISSKVNSNSEKFKVTIENFEDRSIRKDSLINFGHNLKIDEDE